MGKLDHRKTHMELLRLQREVDSLREQASAGMEAEKLATLLAKSDAKVKKLTKEVKELKEKLKEKPEKKKFFSKE